MLGWSSLVSPTTPSINDTLIVVLLTGFFGASPSGTLPVTVSESPSRMTSGSSLVSLATSRPFMVPEHAPLISSAATGSALHHTAAVTASGSHRNASTGQPRGSLRTARTTQIPPPVLLR